MRAIFFEHDDALTVVAQLRRGGWEARAERERLAGEDDDEDHPWAVLTDAPLVQVELLVDQHDGWLDTEPDVGDPGAATSPSERPAPLDLPTEPKRIKRP